MATSEYPHCSEKYTSVGLGHFRNFLKVGEKANREVGGMTMLFEGLRSYSMTGDVFKTSSSMLEGSD